VADVTARLAQGLPAVENAGAYVAACRQLGYHGVSDSSLRDWYGTEDGMDLAALQADSDALSQAASAVDDAVRRQADVGVRLAGAWSGTAASSAQDFLAHQNNAAVAVRDGLMTAAAALATLRDDLWRAVDAKVDAALDIDGRPSGQRGEWLAAAHTVTTGAGDVATASELVDQRVKPFVDNDIGAEWVSEMRAGFDRVADAFDAAIARLEDCPAARFDVPGDAGVAGQPPETTSPVAAPPQGEAAAPVATPPIAAPPGELGGGMPSLGGGMPSLGGGLSGFGQQLADLIGGLTGSADALPDFEDVEEPAEVLAEDEPEDTESNDEVPQDEEPEHPESENVEPEDGAPEDGEPDEEQLADVVPEQPVVPEPEPMSVPTPVAPPQALPEALPAEKTPCEIAAEELPRVGE
jgi:hypothetical protein